MKKDNLILFSSSFPSQLVIYPLENKPIFPGMVSQVMTNNKQLMKIIDNSINTNNFLGMTLLKDPHSESAYRFTNLYRTGVIIKIQKKINLPDGGYNIFFIVNNRFIIKNELQYTPPLIARVQYIEEPKERTPEVTVLTRSLITEMKKILENNPLFSEEVRLNMVNIDHPGQIADFLSAILDLKREEQQNILETIDIQKRMETVLMFVNREQELLKIQKRIQNQINNSVEKHKRRHFLKEMVKEIKKELGEPDGKESEIRAIQKKLTDLPLPEDVRTHVNKEVKRFEILDPHNPEYNVLLSYLEKIIDLPWENTKRKPIDLSFAKKILDKEHYGMQKVKERIIEHLAISKIEKSETKSIICLVGPPGVGKTSIARSIAHALGKKLYHFSVGGMRDEAEIKGHRRTYIGAMPGKIIQGLLYVKENDPVFVIDEIDKISSGIQGDPSSALLEVLDPVQNIHFRDMYIDIPFDLSKIFFITTANTLHTVPPPLIDRMEIIHLSGYIDKEKISIARKYIIPKSLKRHGIASSSIVFSNTILGEISENYAREAGMRKFEQYIDTIIRKILTQKIQNKEDIQKKKGKKPTHRSFSLSKKYNVTSDNLKTYLGIAPFKENIIKRATHVGTALGLAWTSVGGDVLLIEAQAYKGKGAFTLTGTLGDVMKESAHIALSLVKLYYPLYSSQKNKKATNNEDSDAIILQKTETESYDFFSTHDIHLHVPEGATPKDGPSAGITMASALFSFILKKRINTTFAMTGELSLIGKVLPIGGLREKIVAARRNKIKNIIIPNSNISDLQEIPQYIQKGLTIYPVSTIEEVFALLFPRLAFGTIPQKIHPHTTKKQKSGHSPLRKK